ncbi:FAD-dependent monooxygenase [Catenovulum sp. SX2]|uniref:FAD-dependent monooxygenase n=1 Tax=Catenovulum sp. SX2 TaxID=3398614 RepID=UPI003F87C240
MQNNNCDIAIVGAGMVGATLASALKQLGYSCLLLDKTQPTFAINSPTPDLRVSSISLSSVNWLTELGIWQQLDPSRLNAFTQLSMQEKQHASCHFNASDIQQQQLGCFVENQHLQYAALQQFAEPVRVETITDINQTADGWVLDTEQQQIHCQLLIAADGAQSQVRNVLKQPTSGWQYNQACYCANIQLTDDSGQHTWQVFDNHQAQALAFLPLYDNFATLIIYDQPAKLRQLAQQSNAEQTQYLSQLFSRYLKGSDFQFLASASFPLQKMTAANLAKDNLVLLGDAAHTIHPLAGQGVNLGIRDAQLLCQTLSALKGDLSAIHQQNFWRQFQFKRKLDINSMSYLMDLLYYSYSSQSPILKGIRRSLVTGLNQLPLVKSSILKAAIGEFQG